MDFDIDNPKTVKNNDELLQTIRVQAGISTGEIPFEPDIGIDIEDILFQISGNALSVIAKDILNRLRLLDERFLGADLVLETDPDEHKAWIWLILPEGRFRAVIGR